MFKRSIPLPQVPESSYFLLGLRQTGKTTALKNAYPDATYIDLLNSEELRKYISHPESLRQELRELNDSPLKLVIIDEIQKAPKLLNEVHWLIENKKIHFLLCGSSARKLKRQGVNLLGGRALRVHIHGLVSQELGKEFDLTKILNRGYIPNHYLKSNYRERLRSYVADYLRHEVLSEGFVRNIPVYSDFLDIAALSDTEIINFENIARECGVKGPNVKEYFQILCDTMMGTWLPSYTKRPKRRVIQAPKFYFTDVGVVNTLAKRANIEPGSELYGKAFENWVHHELQTYIDYRAANSKLSYWRLASGIEVDFIVDDIHLAIEAKATKRVVEDHMRGLRALKTDQPSMGKRYIVSLETRARRTDDEITILPATEFARRLWQGELF